MRTVTGHPEDRNRNSSCASRPNRSRAPHRHETWSTIPASLCGSGCQNSYRAFLSTHNSSTLVPCCSRTSSRRHRYSCHSSRSTRSPYQNRMTHCTLSIGNQEPDSLPHSRETCVHQYRCNRRRPAFRKRVPPLQDDTDRCREHHYLSRCWFCQLFVEGTTEKSEGRKGGKKKRQLTTFLDPEPRQKDSKHFVPCLECDHNRTFQSLSTPPSNQSYHSHSRCSGSRQALPMDQRWSGR